MRQNASLFNTYAILYAIALVAMTLKFFPPVHRYTYYVRARIESFGKVEYIDMRSWKIGENFKYATPFHFASSNVSRDFRIKFNVIQSTILHHRLGDR